MSYRCPRHGRDVLKGSPGDPSVHTQQRIGSWPCTVGPDAPIAEISTWNCAIASSTVTARWEELAIDFDAIAAEHLALDLTCATRGAVGDGR